MIRFAKQPILKSSMDIHYTMGLFIVTASLIHRYMDSHDNDPTNFLNLKAEPKIFSVKFTKVVLKAKILSY